MNTNVIVASPYPLIIEGVKAMLRDCDDISAIDSTDSCSELDSKIEKLSSGVVIIDLQLSDFCGFDGVKDILDANPSLRFLFISSLNDGKYFEQAVSSGACGFVLNNVTKDELVAAVKTALANEVYVQPRLAKELFGAKRMTNGGKVMLPPRQQQIIELMAEGLSNKEIASRLDLSVETINTHVKQILKRLQARDRAQAVAIAFRKSILL